MGTLNGYAFQETRGVDRWFPMRRTKTVYIPPFNQESYLRAGGSVNSQSQE